MRELQALCGDRYDAEDVLQTLFNVGLIDGEGNPVFDDEYIVDGKSYTLSELRAESLNRDPNQAATIDGIPCNWGAIQKLIQLKEISDILFECKNSTETLTQEHIDNMASLFNQFITDGVSIENNILAGLGGSADVQALSQISLFAGDGSSPDDIETEGAFNFDEYTGMFNRVAENRYTLSQDMGFRFYKFGVVYEIRDSFMLEKDFGHPYGEKYTLIEQPYVASGIYGASNPKSTGSSVTYKEVADGVFEIVVNLKGKSTDTISFDLELDELGSSYYDFDEEWAAIGKHTGEDKASVSWGQLSTRMYPGSYNTIKTTVPEFMTDSYILNNASEITQKTKTNKFPNQYASSTVEGYNPAFYATDDEKIAAVRDISHFKFWEPDTSVKKITVNERAANGSFTIATVFVGRNNEPIIFSDSSKKAFHSGIDNFVGLKISNVGGTGPASFQSTSGNVNHRITSKTFANARGSNAYLGIVNINERGVVHNTSYESKLEYGATAVTAMVSIPDGVYQPFDYIPIHVNFDLALNPYYLKLIVNGTEVSALAPHADYGYTKNVVFLYQNPGNTSGSPIVTDLIRGSLKLNPSSNIGDYTNYNCILLTDKENALDFENYKYSYDAESNKARFEVPVFQNTDAYQMVTTLLSEKKEQVTLYDVAGKKYEGEYHYLRSMYGTTQTNQTFRKKMYLITGGASEAPLKVICNCSSPPTTMGNRLRIDSFAFTFGTSPVYEDVDFLTDYTKKAYTYEWKVGTALEIDAKWDKGFWHFVYPVKGFEDGDITINDDSSVMNNFKDNAKVTVFPPDLFKFQEGVEPLSKNESNIGYYNDQLYLSYDMAEDDDYYYKDAVNFKWSSDDTNGNIATFEEKEVDATFNGEPIKKKICVITPTGTAGSVKFTLTCSNGSTPISVVSKEFVFENNGESYLTIPKSVKLKTGIKNKALDILFTSNVSENNLPDDTAYTLRLFNIDENGEKIGEAFYTTSSVSTKDLPKSYVTIEDSILSKLSNKTIGYSYIGEIETECTSSKPGISGTFTDSFKVVVVPRPIEIYTNETPTAIKDTEDLTFSWDIKYLEPEDVYEYRIIRNSTGEEVESGNATATESGDVTVAKTLSAADIKVTTSLKEIFTLYVTATSSEGDLPPSKVSQITYVYNSDALQLLVENTKSSTYDEDTNTLTMDNYARLSKMMGGTNILPLGEATTTMRELREDLCLQSIISIDYGTFVWGMISDQIEWATTDDNEQNDINNHPFYLDYKQGGFYSPIQTYSYKSYLPQIDFAIAGVRNGTGTITATHAATGMKKEINVDVTTLRDKFYLFQANPAMKTTLIYTNGKDEEITVETDDLGQLALFEPEGIKSEIECRGEKDGDVYICTLMKDEISSGERDYALMQKYYLNKVQLYQIAKVNLSFKDESGKPYANKDITIRGGVYKDGSYCKEAYFDYDHDETASDKGTEDYVLKTDSKGNVRIDMNPSQFYINNTAEELTARTKITYIFEIRAGDSYYPKIVEVKANEGGAYGLNEIVTLRSVKGVPRTPDILTQTMTNSFPEPFDLNGASTIVGPSSKHAGVVINSDIVLWGIDTVQNKDGFWEVPVEVKISGGIEDRTGYYLKGQDTEKSVTTLYNLGNKKNIYSYPFSQGVYMYHKLTLAYQTLGGVMEGNEINWSNAWLKPGEKKPVDFVFRLDGKEIRRIPMSYQLSNEIGSEDLASSPKMNVAAGNAAEQITDKLDIGNILDRLVPGGDMLAKGMSFLTGMASGGDHGVEILTFPTVFKLIISVGEPIGEGGDDNDDDSNTGDGFGIEYPSSNDYKDFAEAMQEEDDGEEDGGGEAEASFNFSGVLTALAKYDIQTNSYPYSNPVLSNDGKIMVYLSDEGSKDIEKTVVNFATSFDGENYVDKGNLAKLPTDTKVSYGFGDTSPVVSGSNGNYFAAWLQQSESFVGTTPELSTLMDSSEVMAAVYNDVTKTWERTKLTQNDRADLSPTITSNGNKAIVAWRAVSSSKANMSDDISFDVADTIVFKIYNGTSWSDEIVCYNGSMGEVKSIQSSMMSDGTSIVTAIVGEGTETETIYIVTDIDGNVQDPVRITNDNNLDVNVQAKTVNDGTDEKFVIGWYTQYDEISKDSEKSVGLKSDMMSASAEFKNLFTVNGPIVDANEIARNTEIPVDFTIVNKGSSVITKVTASFDGVETTFDNIEILPKEEKRFTVYHQTAETIDDVNYTIKAFAGNAEFSESRTTDTLVLNLPDIGISEISIIDKKDALRTMQFILSNSTDIPLKTSGKTVNIGFYATSNHETDSQIGETVTISAADDLEQIDRAVYLYQVNFQLMI